MRLTSCLALALLLASCQESFSAGKSKSHTLLPVDERNPIVLINDNVRDNWQGEYAVLLSNAGGPKLVAIFVDSSPAWPNGTANIEGWRNLVQAAGAAGLEAPVPQTNTSPRLERPSSGVILETQKTVSEAASFIVEESKKLSRSYRPLVVVVGTRLTAVANAYLIDPTVTERVVVVSSLGRLTSNGAAMYVPNGEMDPWADTIVASQFTYVQVSAYYYSKDDVPDALLPDLPPGNAFFDWIIAKRADVSGEDVAADQVGPAAVGIPGFVTDVQQVVPDGTTAAGATTGPRLLISENGNGWLVRQIDPAKATERFGQMLRSLRK